MLISKRVIFLSKEIKFLNGKCYIKAFGFFLLPASFASKTHSCKYSTAGNSNPWSNFTTFTPPGSTFKLWKSSFYTSMSENQQSNYSRHPPNPVQLQCLSSSETHGRSRFSYIIENPRSVSLFLPWGKRSIRPTMGFQRWVFICVRQY